MGNKQYKGSVDAAQTLPADATEHDTALAAPPEVVSDATEDPLINPPAVESARKKSVKRKGGKKPAISPDKFEKFLGCLKEFPFDVDENEFKNVSVNLKVVRFNKNDPILRKGEPGKGVYLVVNGFCNVVTASGDVLRVVEDEDFFGEVSVFYNRPCSATVLCGEDGTELLWLPKNVLENLVSGPVDFPILKWFVKRRYLDIEGTSIQKDIIREMLTEGVKEAPLFHEWSVDAVNSIVRTIIDDQGVICYFAGTEIFSSGKIFS